MSDDAIERYARSIKASGATVRPVEPVQAVDDGGAIARYAQSIKAQEDRGRANLYAVGDATPDDAAKANRLAIETGIPADVVERELGMVEQQAQQRRNLAMVQRYPAIGKFTANPRDAAVSRDDVDGLAKVSRTFREREMLPQFRMAPRVRLPSDRELDAATQGGYLVTPIGQEDAYASAIGVRAVREQVARDEAESFSGNIAALPGQAGRAVGAGGVDILSGTSGVLRAASELSAQFSLGSIIQRQLFGRSVDDVLAANFAAQQGYGKGLAKDVAGDPNRNRFLRDVVSGFRSTPQTAVALGLSAAGLPSVGAAFVGGTVAGDAYGTARAKGLDPIQSAIYGGTQGFIEFATERVPAMKFLADTKAGASFGRKLFNNLAAEMPQEQAATVLQDLNDWVVLNPEKPFSQYLAERPDAALSTAIATAVGSTTVVTTGQAVSSLASGVAKVAQRGEQARQAETDAKFLDDLAKGVVDNKVRKRDPSAFARFLEISAEGTPVEKLYIPGDQVASYFQSNDMDWHDTESGWAWDETIPAQIDEALATGGDVVVRTSDFAAHVAGTPAWDALKDHLRTSAGGMSLSDAQAYAKDEAASLKALGQQFGEQSMADDPRQRLYWSVRDKLTAAGFTQSAADANAAVVTGRYAARAARMGHELTGTEFDTTDVQQVLPAGLAPIVAADQLDLAIATMKRQRDQRTAGQKFGPSLVEWISSRGGVEDKGGDIAALGGATWHKGKVGKKRLIRPASEGPALPGMGGGIGASSGFGLDDMALRAWEAGYLQGEERPTPNDLLDAIGAELGGQPRYAEDRTGQTDAMREAADQLYEIVDRQGIDPIKATGAEIREAVARYQLEQSEGRGFDPADPRILHQSFDDGPRGRITFTGNRNIIDLFQSRNLSTFIHESGHLWLEELRADAETDGAPDGVKADWQAVQDWFAANGHPIVDGAIPVDAHELWARGWERYAMEGKSPSSSLRRAFDQFRSWLLSIYQVVNNLRAPITPEIRAVMDRLIATDEEIASVAEDQNIMALFTSAQQARMTEAEFADYQATVAAARDEAHDALLFKTMEIIRRSRTKAWKDEESGVRDDVTASVNRRPEFRALHLLRTGKMLDDPDAPAVRVKLDRAWLIETYGADALSTLPKGVPPIYADKDVTHADIVAEMAGFQSGDEMVRTLMAVEERTRQLRAAGDKRSARVAIIDQETAAIMTERHGDPLTDGSIEEEALAAIHNDRQGEVIAAEMRALSRKTGDTPTPYRLARQWAARTIAQSQVADAVSGSAIQRYARAAAKAAKAAEQAMLKGDAAETFRQKQSQMLNNALIAEAKVAKDRVDVAVSRLGKLARRATIKSIDQDYLDQVHGLLEQVEFRQRSQRDIERQESFEEWAQAQEAAGYDVVVPPSFAAVLGQRNWSRLTIEELTGLDDTIKQIVHLGRLKQKLLDGQDEREFNAVVDEVEIAAAQLPPRPPKGGFTDPTWWDSIKGGVAAMDAALLKMETVFDWLDGGNPDGVFNRTVFRPITEAQHRQAEMTADYVGRLTDLLKAIPKAQLSRWMDRVTVPELIDPATGDPMITTRDRLISMALNMGNEGNARKLAGGYSWNEATVMAVLDRELSAEDWTYVQAVWDTIDGLWPEAQAMEKRLNGVVPDKIEARVVQTRHGPFRGGYFPVVYDPAKDYDTAAQAAKSADLFESSYVRASTRSGSLNERTKVERPIYLSLGVINRHVVEVIHDITHREAVMAAWRLLSDKRVMRAVDESLGPEIQQQFKPWLQHIANEFAAERAGLAGWEKLVKGLRTNATMVGMAYRASTVIMQIAGYSNSIEVIGEKWFAIGAAETVKNPISAFNYVLEHSAEVRGRMDTLDRDIRDGIRQTLGDPSVGAAVKRYAFYGVGYMDRMVVVPTWLGAYNKELAGGATEADAIYAADKAVRKSQGSGAAKDLASVQRGGGRAGEAMKLLTMFYSYMSAFYQRQRTFGRDVGSAVREGRVSDFPRLLARAWWLFAVPAVLSELLAGRGPDDDEDYAAWVAQRMLLQSVGPIPFLRDVAGPVTDKLLDNPSFGYKFTPAQGAFDSALRTVGDIGNIVEGEDTTRMTRNVLETMGYVTGMVPGQLAASTQFIVDVGYGEQDPKTLGDWVEGLAKGKIKEE